MPKLSLDEYLGLTEKSGLVAGDQLQAAKAEFLQLGGGPEDAEGFADFLRGKGLLTAWHNGKLLHRKYKGFFLGKYKFLDRIGSGGMGRVYLAEHVSLHRRSAIKVLPHSRLKDSSLVDRFHLEARALAKLDHKNIVKVYDVDHEGDVHYIVMEFVAGQDLESYVAARGPLSGTRAAHYIGQAAAGLAHVHSRNLVHRDIKPSNLLLGRANLIKLLDLGLARLAEDEASLTRQFSDRALGTTDYISPEQAMDSHAVDVRTDIYSLGCTFYFLVTGHPPFHQGSIASRLLAHQTQEPPGIEEERARAGIPPIDRELIAICRKMMAKDPDDRYQDAKQVFDAIADWLDGRRSSARAGRSRAAVGRAAPASGDADSAEFWSAMANAPIAEQPTLGDDIRARETSASQATTPTTVNPRVGVAPTSAHVPSSNVDADTFHEPTATAARDAFRRQLLWASVAAGGTAVIMLAFFILFLMLTRES